MEIKRELVIKSTPPKVFKAITDPQQLTQWFPDIAYIEPKIGGKISFKFSESDPNNIIQDHIIEGEIIELEKNKKIVYTWGHQDNSDFPLTQVSWNLEKIGVGMTKVIITHRGFTDEKIMITYNDGWSWFMGRLSIFATPKQPVNVGGQIISAFIPGSTCLHFIVLKNLESQFCTYYFPP